MHFSNLNNHNKMSNAHVHFPRVQFFNSLLLLYHTRAFKNDTDVIVSISIRHSVCTLRELQQRLGWIAPVSLPTADRK